MAYHSPYLRLPLSLLEWESKRKESTEIYKVLLIELALLLDE